MFEIVELRRYTIHEGLRERFAEHFDTLFPEAFQQLGALAVGQFFERDNPSMFTWLRAYHDMDSRAVVNASFYYGPVWKEHRAVVNPMMIDSDNVLLLRAVRPMLILPTLLEPARGTVVAQIFAGNDVDRWEETFTRYRDAGAREAAVLVTLDAPNNFPQLPVRTDGPYVVWVGIGDAIELSSEAIETIVMTPTRRSRLRAF
jgi:hypothetical protein